MLNYIWATLIIIGICVAGLLGRFGGEDGIIDGAFSMARIGVMNIALPLAAIMMIWLGVMRLAEKSGMIDLVARAVRPVMKWLFPDVPADHPAMGAMISIARILSSKLTRIPTPPNFCVIASVKRSFLSGAM
ncbi:MAG: hypothetical protein L3J39_14900 [Verrucomicrobiales bacterium]|nr:hypothetical protein [Verrucomicrobiales bacterium]